MFVLFWIQWFTTRKAAISENTKQKVCSFNGSLILNTDKIPLDPTQYFEGHCKIYPTSSYLIMMNFMIVSTSQIFLGKRRYFCSSKKQWMIQLIKHFDTKKMSGIQFWVLHVTPKTIQWCHSCLKLCMFDVEETMKVFSQEKWKR